MLQGIEKRGFPRYRCEPLLCRMRPGLQRTSVLRDVSMSGVYLLNREPPPVGAAVELQFDEAPFDGYRLRGRVVRHGAQHVGFGVAFAEPHPRLLRVVYCHDPD
ncbi:MAG: PilZ domain-containing protein [Deltaproteobacteria bacterium]|nr:PilZ domain-containing protein [Deltaproteobacteria bacterium]